MSKQEINSINQIIASKKEELEELKKKKEDNKSKNIKINELFIIAKKIRIMKK